MRLPASPFFAIVLVATLASCDEKPAAGRKPPADRRGRTLATVNGLPITQSDLEQRLRKGSAGGAHDVSNNVLNAIVRDELIFQKAVQLGLDEDPEYRQKVDEIEAQLRAFQRHELAALYRAHVRAKAAVTDAEAREFFDKNAQEIRTRLHVLQLLYKGKGPEVEKALVDLKSGTPFEKVAARRFPSLPPNVKAPWDLGELYWFQLPPAWKGVVDRLEPGQVTDIIQGENDRFWLVKLVSRAVDPSISFATERERIVELLRQEKADALYDGMLAEMKRTAAIVYSR